MEDSGFPTRLSVPGTPDHIQIIPGGTPRKYALSRLSDQMAPDVAEFSARKHALSPLSSSVASPRKLADTIENLMKEIERSHRSEASARQQAADAIASKQLLTEASNAAVAELESALEGERVSAQRRLRQAELERKSQAVRLRVDRFLLTNELRAREGETATSGAELRAQQQRLSREPEQSARIAELNAEIAALRMQLAPLENSISTLREEAETRERESSAALAEARCAREADAIRTEAALRDATARAQRADAEVAAMRAEVASATSSAQLAEAAAARARRRAPLIRGRPRADSGSDGTRGDGASGGGRGSSEGVERPATRERSRGGAAERRARAI